MEPKWREVWARLDIAYDDYIRTTEPRHEEAVQKLLTAVHENGRDDIYLGTYEGLYCVSCEAYYTEDDLVEAGSARSTSARSSTCVEENYFFRLSAYADRLLEHYEAAPRRRSSPRPGATRSSSLIRGGLQDFSISRTTVPLGRSRSRGTRTTSATSGSTRSPTTSPRPGTATDPSRFARVWPANIHLIGKDILRFHAVYWPAMLMAAGVEPPTQVWAHGFLTVGGKKMSKTNATGIHPFELIDQFGVDSYRYFFMREIQFGQDGSFSWESMVERHNADLANGLGNLASRVLAMLGTSNFDGVVPEPGRRRVPRPTSPRVIADVDPPVRRAHARASRSPRRWRAVWEIVGRANQLPRREGSRGSSPRTRRRRDELAGVLYASRRDAPDPRDPDRARSCPAPPSAALGTARDRRAARGQRLPQAAAAGGASATRDEDRRRASACSPGSTPEMRVHAVAFHVATAPSSKLPIESRRARMRRRDPLRPTVFEPGSRIRIDWPAEGVAARERPEP